MSNASIRRIGAKVNDIKVGTMVTIIERVYMFEMETITVTTTSTGVIMVIGMIGVGLIPPRNWEVFPRNGGGSMVRVEDMLQKMIMIFDTTNDYSKEMRGDLANI